MDDRNGLITVFTKMAENPIVCGIGACFTLAMVGGILHYGASLDIGDHKMSISPRTLRDTDDYSFDQKRNFFDV